MAARFPPYPARAHSSRQARIKIAGRVYYLGVFGSPASWAEYRRLLAEWEQGTQPTPRRASPAGTVNELLAAYVKYATTYYVKNGQPTGQLERVKRSLAFVRDLYGPQPVERFDQRALELVRGEMVRADYCRSHVNACVGCIRRCWRWAAARQHFPVGLYQSLCLLEDLKKGRCQARESEPVRPVPVADVERTLPFLCPPLAACVRLQLLTGMRPGEVLALRLGDLDRTGDVWIYRPASHKTEHRGHLRTIYLGPQAQAVLTPFMQAPFADPGWQPSKVQPRDPDAYLFSPRETLAWLSVKRRSKRRTKIYRCEGKRRKRKPGRTPGAGYSHRAYGRAVARACEMAGVPHYHPNQLRHSAATRIRSEHGPDAARAVLGHRSLEATEIYAEADGDKVRRIMEKAG